MNRFILCNLLCFITSYSYANPLCDKGLNTLGSNVYKTGFQQLTSAVRATSVNSEKLVEAQRVFDALSTEKVDRLSILADTKLKSRSDSHIAQDNLSHVENQHLKPLENDRKFLEAAFGINPDKLNLLMLVHDLGKVETPKEMDALLKLIYPEGKDFVARVILPHEYASMYWIEKLGREAGLNGKEIVSLKRLIANHNFGIDLSKPENQELTADWWPSNFRNLSIPQLIKLGINPNNVFSKDATGKYQYGHAEGNVYSALLSVYDRAIASKFNQDGLETWRKFAQQDYTAWKNSSLNNTDLKSSFNAKDLTSKMELAANGTRAHLSSLWNTLGERHAKTNFALDGFTPYQNQIQSLDRLQKLIAKVKELNKENTEGGVLWTNKPGNQFWVKEGDMGGLYKKSPAGWEIVQRSDNPIATLFDLIKKDI